MNLVIYNAPERHTQRFKGVFQINVYGGLDIMHVFHDFHGITMNTIIKVDENDQVFLEKGEESDD